MKGVKKFIVRGLISASKKVGEYEAETEEAAIEKAEQDSEADVYVSLCHHCAKEIDIGDVYDYQAEEITG